MDEHSTARGGDAKGQRGNKYKQVKRHAATKFAWDAGSDEEDRSGKTVSKDEGAEQLPRKSLMKQAKTDPSDVSTQKEMKQSLVLQRLVLETEKASPSDTTEESLQERLLRIMKSGEDEDFSTVARRRTGRPNWREAAAEKEARSLCGNPNFEPVKDSAGLGNDESLNETDDTSGRGKFHSQGRGFYNRGRGVRRPHLGDLRRIGQRSTVKHLERTRDNFEYATNQVVQSELLLQEEGGFIELEPGEKVTDVTQRNIQDAVDITAATKIFELNLHKYGPYRIDYTRNGRHLLLGGRKGHVAVVEWLSKRLLCEINVMDAVYDVAWLHQETMFAVAQKDWLYIYDNQGTELHCIDKMRNVLRMEYLPYHFLLATANDSGFLQWLDISIGKMVANTRTTHKRLDVMCQNPWNAVLMLGHTTGTVTMWAPNMQNELATMLCHRQPIRAMAVNSTGNYMATAASDGYVKMWDLRAMKSLHGFRMRAPPTNLAFSQRGLLAVGMQNYVQVLKDCCTKMVTSPYLCHSVGSQIRDLVYCPYEDVLGIGHMGGFSSILVPGASEANFDSLESNPFQSKTQRRQQEVKSLLDKIQPEMICLDPTAITSVASIPLESEGDNDGQMKRPKIVLKSKTRGKSDSANLERRRNIQKDIFQRAAVRETMRKKKEMAEQAESDDETSTYQERDVLDRFKQRS